MHVAGLAEVRDLEAAAGSGGVVSGDDGDGGRGLGARLAAGGGSGGGRRRRCGRGSFSSGLRRCQQHAPRFQISVDLPEKRMREA